MPKVSKTLSRNTELFMEGPWLGLLLQGYAESRSKEIISCHRDKDHATWFLIDWRFSPKVAEKMNAYPCEYNSRICWTPWSCVFSCPASHCLMPTVASYPPCKQYSESNWQPLAWSRYPLYPRTDLHCCTHARSLNLAVTQDGAYAS